MIWTILGFSVAVIAAYCVTLAETVVGNPVFETFRPYVAMFLGMAGGVAWLIGRALGARDAKRPDAPARFLLFDLRYWGPMLFVLGVITVFIFPLKMQQVAEVSPPKPAAKTPPPAPAPTPIVRAPSFPKVKFQGVIYRESQPFVILDGESYTIGDHIGNAIVRSIDRTSVLLESEGVVKVLSLN